MQFIMLCEVVLAFVDVLDVTIVERYLPETGKCFWVTTRCDWLTKFAPFSQPMRNKNKTNRALLARVSPRLPWVTHAFASSADWVLVLSSSVLIC